LTGRITGNTGDVTGSPKDGTGNAAGVTGGGLDARRGTAYGAGAYALWGTFPLYFHLLAPAGAWEILAHRIVWTLLVCLAVLSVRAEFGWCRSVFGNPRMLGAVTLAGLLIAVN